MSTEVGIIYHPRQEAARGLAQRLGERLEQRGIARWALPAYDTRTPGLMPGTGLVVCVGGDGTMLWAARYAAPAGVPLLGVNLGRVGFLAELEPEELDAQVERALAGEGRTERRTMVEAVVEEGGRVSAEPLLGLNDVVVGRPSVGRPVYLTLRVGGETVAVVRADAMIVATATGSTGYNLSAGGPVLTPQDSSLIVTAVAPHLSRMKPIVLPGDSTIELQVQTEHQAMLSIDGQIDLPLETGARVTVRRSLQVAHFIRFGAPGAFYHRLARHLDLLAQGGERA